MKKWGIDISTWQKGINLSQAKNEGVEFAILRAGFSTTKDNQFETFYSQCKSLGIPVGAYLYSYATTVEQAKAEARALLGFLKGKQFEYPIVLDIEDKCQKKLSKDQNDAMIRAFGEIIEAAGYWFSVYTNVDFYNNYCHGKTLNAKYDWWMARWSSVAYTGYNCGMTQFGGETNYIRSNKVAGRVVDQNYAYYDYPALMKQHGLNGYSKQSSSNNENNSNSQPQVVKKDVDTLAHEVIANLWGTKDTTPTRKERLEAAGYDYAAVQNRVNEILGVKTTPATPQAEYYVVKRGDCLWNIALKYYGNGNMYTTIKALNNLKSNVIYAGQKLRVK